MEARIETFDIESEKIKENKKIITLADLHLSLKLNKKILLAIKQFLDDNRDSISLITMPGDIMYSFNYSNPEYMSRLKYLLCSFSEIKTPITLSLGNHDLQSNEEKTKGIFKSLSKIENVYPLDNEKVKISDMTVAGFSPSHDVYKPSYHGIKANRLFTSEFLKSNLTFNANELNILLNHAPHPIASDYSQVELKDILEKIDLIIAGHLHNGYVPDFIEEKFKESLKDYGLWETPSILPPKFLSKINLCRGIHNLGNTKLVISKGIRPYTGYIPASIPITPNITVVNINGKQKVR